MAETEMEYRPLGRCGTQVSVFGLGGWLTFGGSIRDKAAIRAILQAAFEAGVNFFDTADVYAHGDAERAMGQVLANFPRHELVIASKVFFPMSDDVNDRGLSRKHVFESAEKSLRRLGTDYLDVYFCHRFDEQTPVEETARAMDDLVHQGKVLYWGTSEWSGQQIREVNNLCTSAALYRPQVEQPQYSLLARGKFEGDVRPVLEEYGMGAVVWSPLCMGLLTGKYDDGLPADSRFYREEWLRQDRYTEENLDRVRRFKPHADRLGCTRTQLALAWAAAQPGVSSVIFGVASIEQLTENLGAMGVLLSEGVGRALNELFPAGTAG
jgi:voltage-dependent potassium channel beta subunit